jgi:hypothetical protein
MKKILFFTDTSWAFGSIHYGLSRFLHEHGVLSNVLSWDDAYSKSEIKMMKSSYDLFVSTPNGGLILNSKFGISLEKIICVAHSEWDIKSMSLSLNNDFYNNIFDYSVVCEHLFDVSSISGITRRPKVSKLGIDFNLFYRKIPQKLKTVGYAGAKWGHNFEKNEIKRYECFLKSVEISGLQKIELDYCVFSGMPGYYDLVDSIMVTSTEEGAGLPSMEAAAAGRLVFSTPVGYFRYNHHNGAGVALPVEKEDLINMASEYLTYYSNNDKEFNEKCTRMQDFARENYHWTNVLDTWLSMFLK